MSDPNKKQNQRSTPGRFRKALRYLEYCCLCGLGFIFLFALQMNSRLSVLSVFGAGALVGGASFFLGGLLGFLFGIPKAAKLQNQREDANKGRYEENTNLEDISDWLTKIIIGVGLVELSKIPQLLNQFAEIIAPTLGGVAGSKGFAIAIFAYYSVNGFLLIYLSTRIYMESGLERLNDNSQIASKE